LNASSIRENVSAAISTPLPKAIMAAMIPLGRFANNAIMQPITRGMLAIKPHRSDSNIV
jgi:hypothetical protein